MLNEEYIEDFDEDEFEDFAKKLYYLSVAEFMESPSERRLERPKINLQLPKVGIYILYNRVGTVYGHKGHPVREPRGIGKVLGYTSNLILIREYRNPHFTIDTAFSIRSDIWTGHFKYVELRDVVYKEDGKSFSYHELDLNHPYPMIKNYIIK